MELPYELEDLVLGYLVDDASALRNCSLACRRFTPIAQRCLFTRSRVKFIFTESKDHSRQERFRSLILSSPHIAKLVESVSVINNNDNTRNLAQLTHFLGETNLPECLPMLTSLRDFSLENTGLAALYWTSASRRMKIALGTIFQFVTNIYFFRIMNIPLSVLAGCRALESLSLV